MAVRKREDVTAGTSATNTTAAQATVPGTAVTTEGATNASSTGEGEKEKRQMFSWFKGGTDQATGLPVRILALLQTLAQVKTEKPGDYTMLDIVSSLKAHPAVVEDAELLTPEAVRVQLGKLRKLGPEYKAAIGAIPSGEASGAPRGRVAVELNREAIAALLGISGTSTQASMAGAPVSVAA